MCFSEDRPNDIQIHLTAYTGSDIIEVHSSDSAPYIKIVYFSLFFHMDKILLFCHGPEENMNSFSGLECMKSYHQIVKFKSQHLIYNITILHKS